MHPDDAAPAQTRGTARAAALAALLAPYGDPALTDRLRDVPPAVARRVLALLPADLSRARFNLSQPPMWWLVVAASDLDGRLVGGLVPGREFVRLDGVQVVATAARGLAERIGAAFPATPGTPGALESAVAEGWTSWTAEWPAWTGTGLDLLTGEPPEGVAVVGLWWD